MGREAAGLQTWPYPLPLRREFQYSGTAEERPQGLACLLSAGSNSCGGCRGTGGAELRELREVEKL